VPEWFLLFQGLKGFKVSVPHVRDKRFQSHTYGIRVRIEVLDVGFPYNLIPQNPKLIG
jgi:hypothetical protein